jgi:hypothetical protein
MMVSCFNWRLVGKAEFLTENESSSEDPKGPPPLPQPHPTPPHQQVFCNKQNGEGSLDVILRLEIYSTFHLRFFLFIPGR